MIAKTARSLTREGNFNLAMEQLAKGDALLEQHSSSGRNLLDEAALLFAARCELEHSKGEGGYQEAIRYLALAFKHAPKLKLKTKEVILKM